MNTETTALTVRDRAAVALGSLKAEQELIDLASRSKSITSVTNPDGRTECHSAAMTAKAARIAIEKAGKAARDDSTAFSKAVIAEEKRLVDLIEPEESRLLALRDAFDEKVAREKAEKAEADRLRINAIRARIDALKEQVSIAALKDAAGVLLHIEYLEPMEIDDSFGEFYGEASESKNVALSKLKEIHAAKLAAEAEALRIQKEREAEAARIIAEREELARQRAEQERVEAQRRIEREEQERQLQAQRDELSRQQKAIDDQRAEQDRIRKEEQERADREAAAKVEAEQKAAKEAADKAEAERKAAEAAIAKPVEVVEQTQSVQSIAPVQMQASQAQEQTIQPALVRESRPQSDSSTGKNIEHFVFDLLCQMDAAEKTLVLHYCERLVANRKGCRVIDRIERNASKGERNAE